MTRNTVEPLTFEQRLAMVHQEIQSIFPAVSLTGGMEHRKLGNARLVKDQEGKPLENVSDQEDLTRKNEDGYFIERSGIPISQDIDDVIQMNLRRAIQRITSNNFDNTKLDAAFFAEVLHKNRLDNQTDRERFEAMIGYGIPTELLNETQKLYRHILEEYRFWARFKQDLILAENIKVGVGEKTLSDIMSEASNIKNKTTGPLSEEEKKDLAELEALIEQFDPGTRMIRPGVETVSDNTPPQDYYYSSSEQQNVHSLALDAKRIEDEIRGILDTTQQPTRERRRTNLANIILYPETEDLSQELNKIRFDAIKSLLGESSSEEQQKLISEITLDMDAEKLNQLQATLDGDKTDRLFALMAEIIVDRNQTVVKKRAELRQLVEDEIDSVKFLSSEFFDLDESFFRTPFETLQSKYRIIAAKEAGDRTEAERQVFAGFTLYAEAEAAVVAAKAAVVAAETAEAAEAAEAKAKVEAANARFVLSVKQSEAAVSEQEIKYLLKGLREEVLLRETLKSFCLEEFREGEDYRESTLAKEIIRIQQLQSSERTENEAQLLLLQSSTETQTKVDLLKQIRFEYEVAIIESKEEAKRTATESALLYLSREEAIDFNERDRLLKLIVEEHVEERLKAEERFAQYLKNISAEYRRLLDLRLRYEKLGYGTNAGEVQDTGKTTEKEIEQVILESTIAHLSRDVKGFIADGVINMMIRNEPSLQGRGYGPDDVRINQNGLRKLIREYLPQVLRAPENDLKYAVGSDVGSNRQFRAVDVAAASYIQNAYRIYQINRKRLAYVNVENLELPKAFRSVLADALLGEEAVDQDDQYIEEGKKVPRRLTKQTVARTFRSRLGDLPEMPDRAPSGSGTAAAAVTDDSDDEADDEAEDRDSDNSIYQRVRENILRYDLSGELKDVFLNLVRLKNFVESATTDSLPEGVNPNQTVEGVFYANLLREMQGLRDVLTNAERELRIAGEDFFQLDEDKENAFAKLVNDVNFLRRWIGLEERTRAFELDKILRAMLQKSQERIQGLEQRLTANQQLDEEQNRLLAGLRQNHNSLQATVDALGRASQLHGQQILGLTGRLNTLEGQNLDERLTNLREQFDRLGTTYLTLADHQQFVEQLDQWKRELQQQLQQYNERYDEAIVVLQRQVQELINRPIAAQPAVGMPGVPVMGLAGIPGVITVNIESRDINDRLQDLRNQVLQLERQRAQDIANLTGRFDAVDEANRTARQAIDRMEAAMGGLLKKEDFDARMGQVDASIAQRATTAQLNQAVQDLSDSIENARVDLETRLAATNAAMATGFNRAEQARRADVEERGKQIAGLRDNVGDELSRMMAELTAQNDGLRRQVDALQKDKDASASKVVDFDKVRELTQQELLSDIMVESIRGGGDKGKFEIKPYGLAISEYDGIEIVQHSTHVRLAHEAWSRASSGEHNDDTRYTSFTGSKQPSLVSISRITNRPIPGGETPSYMITTVDKNGVGQIFMSEDVFEREINKPLSDAYQARVTAITTALQNGQVPNFEEVLGFAVDPANSVSVRLIGKAVEKTQQENLANAEKAADQSLQPQYQALIGLVENPDVKKRIGDLLAKGDYASVRGSFTSDVGGLREDLFGANPAAVNQARGIWGAMNFHRNADLALRTNDRQACYGELASLISDRALRTQWARHINRGEYDQLYDKLKALNTDPAVAAGASRDRANTLKAQILQLENSFAAPRVALCEKFAELIADPDKKKEYKQILRDQGFEEFLYRARNEFVEDPANPLSAVGAFNDGVVTDRRAAAAIFRAIAQEIKAPTQSSNLVDANLEYSARNYAVVRKVLEEEHARLEEVIQSREASMKARGEFNFTRDRLQKLVDAMADRPPHEEIALMLGTESTDRNAYLAKLFEQDGNGNYVNEKVFADGQFNAARDAYQRIVDSDLLVAGAVGKLDAAGRQALCDTILAQVDRDRPSKASIQSALNSAKDLEEVKKVAEKLFTFDANGVAARTKQGLFDKIVRDHATNAVTAFELENAAAVGAISKFDAAKKLAEESQAKTPAAKLQRDTFVSKFVGVAPETEKRDELASVIKHMKEHETSLQQGRGSIHHLCTKSIADAVQNNGLAPKIAARIASKASVVHGDTLLQRKVEVANIINADVAALSPEEKLRLAGKDKDLQRVFDMKFPPTSYGGAAFSKKAYNQHTVMFNGDFNEVADPANKGSGFPAKYCYIPVPGRDDVFVRAMVCTVNNMIPKQRSVKDPVTGEKRDETYYVMKVRKNGDLVEEEHKPGDVVMDYNTVHHLTVMKDGQGKPIIDVRTGKPKVDYKPISLEGSYESVGKRVSQVVNALTDLSMLAIPKRFGAGSLIESKTAGELEFGEKEFYEIKRHYKEMKILVGSVGANGERSFSTLCNGEIINHSAGRATYTSAVFGKTPNPVIDRTAFAEDGEHLQFTFAKDGSLKGGSLGTIQHGGNTYYGNSMYIKSKELVLPGVDLFGQVSVISHNQDSITRCSEMGNVVFSTNIFYKNAAGQCLEIFDPITGAVDPEFVNFAQGKGITTDAAFFKKLAEMRTRFPQTTSATISVKTEGLDLNAAAVQQPDGGWTLDDTRTYKVAPLATKIEIQPGIMAPASSDMKRDLLQAVASVELRGRAAGDRVESANLDRIRKGRQDSQQTEMNNATRNLIRFTREPNPNPICRMVTPIAEVPVKKQTRAGKYLADKFTRKRVSRDTDDLGIRGM